MVNKSERKGNFRGGLQGVLSSFDIIFEPYFTVTLKDSNFRSVNRLISYALIHVFRSI